MPASPSESASENRLAETTSPYLLQHKDNPVHWQPWGPEALALARSLNKPICLSIGYAACHWCHVMAHESFEDEATAAVMNELYVNIKVDREERPDIDAIYMNALHLLGVPGGWPLTMFLTPEGEPFWGGTYFPRESRFGQPAFRDVLRAVHRAFREQPAAIDKNRTALREALGQLSASPEPLALEPGLLDHVAERIASQIDRQYGGVRGAPKFPQTGLLELLWRAHLRTGEPSLAHAVTVSLDAMCQGGIYDHLGGGFSRYSVDEHWLVPHFEKMLYDNAALIDILSLVWRKTRSPLYAERVAETVGWTLREMRAPDGGFAASYDADSEGEEGLFYVWRADEIVSLLGRESALFCGTYDVSEEGNWEGHTILNRLKAMERLSPDAEAKLARARQVLFEKREARVRPGFDDKVLSDWNGLMIGALVRAGLSFQRPDWIAAAADAFSAVVRHLGYDDRGESRLHHSYRAGRAHHAAIADGYANMARAALLLSEATGDADYRAKAAAWVDVLDRHYWDGTQGGYFYTADDAEALIARSRFAHDNPVPNANGTMIEVLHRLYHATGATAYRERADHLLLAFSGELQRNFFPLATYLNGFDFALHARQIVIRGHRNDAQTQAFAHAGWEAPVTPSLVEIVAPDAILPAGHPARDRPLKDGQPTAYVCQGTVCSLPVTDPAALVAALAGSGS